MHLKEGHKQAGKLALVSYTLSMGGVSNFILELGKFLVFRGYSVTVICTDRKGNWYHRIEQEGMMAKSFDSTFWEWIPFGRILHAMRVGRYLKRQSYTCILNNHSFYVHAAAGYIYPGSRIIHIVHNQLEPMVAQESDPLSDKLVGVSPRIEELAGKYLPRERITSILNGVKLPGSPPQNAQTCADRPGDLLFVGRIDNRQKSVFLIPVILEYLLNREVRVRMTIVGEGPDLEKLKQVSRSRGLSDSIHFAGKIEPEKVGDYYYKHKIFLLPSVFEGHPLTLMEAMAHGCVPVASFLPQCTDICIDEGNSGFLVTPGEASGFGKRIEELLGSSELLNRLSKSALHRSEEQFSIEKSHQQYLELLQSLERRETKGGDTRLINRKYMTWKEIVPFQWVMYIKRKIWKAN